ncbi:hypothetical protein [Litorilituus lipolyticus]|uniref:Uncharacterized protein n=1 Tax=Litorilituus lipolyticus TaxID=2491017 RepID=A0A502KKZ9_9GAMM|nr:hypothetical protein [Litorilituus lipolyticus]TPH12106.1 hypothetical protein EPA86_17270 [Litorilituus lipolyticus]
MAIDPNFDESSSEELDFDNEESSSDLSNDIAEFELNSGLNVGKNSKANYKRNLLAKQRIEQLQEERRLKKFEDDYYGDWD